MVAETGNIYTSRAEGRQGHCADRQRHQTLPILCSLDTETTLEVKTKSVDIVPTREKVIVRRTRNTADKRQQGEEDLAEHSQVTQAQEVHRVTVLGLQMTT